MLHDAGSWHYEFNAVVKRIREKLLSLAHLGPAQGYEVILMQGSGTFGVEAVLGSVTPPNGKVLILANGAYGERLVQMTARLKIDHEVLRFAEDAAPDGAAVDAYLTQHPGFTHVALVHCETTTGLLNPIREIGQQVRRHGLVYIVDAMSSFGGIPIDFEAAGIDYLISSANKCIEGVPGFSFIFARRADLLRTQGWARSLSLDVLGQLQGFEKNGQFRYTPPTHSVLAFDQALTELEEEGGIAARAERYARNHRCLLTGMAELGFEAYLPARLQSYIITAFRYPKGQPFDFSEFYRALSEMGFIIYPGKLTAVDTFRIGTIGRLFEGDLAQLVQAVGQWQKR